MPYFITCDTLTKTGGNSPKTAIRETALEAWALVQVLHSSGERTIVEDDTGAEIGWAELRALATEEDA